MYDTRKTRFDIKQASIFSFIICFMTLGIMFPSYCFGYSFRDEPCFTATQRVERILHIPDGFLYAISRVETSQTSSQGGAPTWPWTVNVDGQGYHYESKREAIDAVQQFQQRGRFYIDVGCLQVNIHHHPEAFLNLEQAFDPFYNTLFAGKFLLSLHDKMKSWPLAAAAYHSQTPDKGSAYQWKVLQAWSLPQTHEETTRTPYALHKPWRKPPIAHPLSPAAPYVTSDGAALQTHLQRPMIAGPTPPIAPHAMPRGSAFQTHRSLGSPNVADSVRVPENSERNRTLSSYRAHPTRKATELPMRTSPY